MRRLLLTLLILNGLLVTELDPVDPRVQTAYESALRPDRMYPLAAAGCLVLLSFLVLLRLYRRTPPNPDALHA